MTAPAKNGKFGQQTGNLKLVLLADELLTFSIADNESASVSFPRGVRFVYVCVYALQACVCVRFSRLCVSLFLPKITNEHTEGPAGCLRIFCVAHVTQIF